MIASGIFDNPLVVFAVLIAGAIIQWLTQKRQAEEARRQSEAEQAGEAATPEPPREESALERKLRELLGQAPGREPEPDSPWQNRETVTPSHIPDRVYREPAPPVVSRPAPPQIATQSRAFRGPAAPKEMGRSLEVMKARLPSEMPGLRNTRHRGSPNQSWLWRDRKSARHAFVASLVFGPPKGLEP